MLSVTGVPLLFSLSSLLQCESHPQGEEQCLVHHHNLRVKEYLVLKKSVGWSNE